jgi:hypothetical protein
LSCDRRNIIQLIRGFNLGSLINNENIANNILYDINNDYINSNNTKNKLDVNSNNYFYNANKIKNDKLDEKYLNEKKKENKQNRPFTANLIRNNNNTNNIVQNNLEGNNIINININVYNIQNNNNNGFIINNSNRFLNPQSKTNLIYVNEDLKKSKTKINDLPYFNKDNIIKNRDIKKISNYTSIDNLKNNINRMDEDINLKRNLENIKPLEKFKNNNIIGLTNNLNLINFNSNPNIKKTTEIIFDNLAKNIGKSQIGNKILTIDDLK